jgi:hypothetical protein
MRSTHQLIIEYDHICALGNGRYFSWIIEPSFGEWDLSTIYGRTQGTFKTLRAALDHIGFERYR